jgi:hypothetical protein
LGQGGGQRRIEKFCYTGGQRGTNGNQSPAIRIVACENGARHLKKSDGVLRQGISVKYAFIERHRRDWPVSTQCFVLGVSARGFQQYLRRKKMPDNGAGRVSDMALLTHIKAIHAETRGAYGWPRIWRELRQRGVRVGQERDDAGQRHSGTLEAEIQSDDRQPSWFAGFG